MNRIPLPGLLEFIGCFFVEIVDGSHDLIVSISYEGNYTDLPFLGAHELGIY